VSKNQFLSIAYYPQCFLNWLKVDGIRCSVENHVVVHISWTAPVTVKSYEPESVVARIDGHMKQKFCLIGVCVQPDVFADVADVETKRQLSRI